MLGAGEFDNAVSVNIKLIAFSIASSTAVGLLLAVASPFIPYITRLPTPYGACRPVSCLFRFMHALYAFATASYFTVRSGGKTWLTFILDAGILGSAHSVHCGACLFYKN
jgi:Na+-driven multidrug efflux pump